MALELIVGLLFSFFPIMELRAAIPFIVDYGIRTGVPYLPWVALSIVFNIMTIIFIFLFLDFLHHRFMRLERYRKAWDRWVHNKLKKKVDKLEKKHRFGQYLGLLFFISIPLPGTGVWTSTTVSWLMGLDRTKSFFTIALGAVIAGIIIFLVSLGLLS